MCGQKVDESELLLKNDFLPFDSHKQPLPVSDHKLFSFWVVTLMKGLTVLISILHCICNKLISCLCFSFMKLMKMTTEDPLLPLLFPKI